MQERLRAILERHELRETDAWENYLLEEYEDYDGLKDEWGDGGEARSVVVLGRGITGNSGRV